uniref:Uncharacterized protein n=1 Tax=mine drainage metagenome TaxID=410659 RepID=E6PTC4_9ZZZZ
MIDDGHCSASSCARKGRRGVTGYALRRVFVGVGMAGCSIDGVFGAAVRRLSRLGSGGITRVASAAPSHPNSQPTTPPPSRRWLVEGSRTAACGQGAMGVIPADSLALGARVAHVFVATSDKAAVLPRPASPVRTAAVPNRLSRPYVHRRRHQLFFQQPSPRSWPGLSSSRAIEGAPRGR